MNILDFARVSWHVYKDPVINRNNFSMSIAHPPLESDQFFPESLSRNCLYEVILDPGIQGGAAIKNNQFYASLYVKVVNNRAVGAVIAIRGSDNLANYRQDGESWAANVLDPDWKVIPPKKYVLQALHFYHKVKAYVQKNLHLGSDQLFVVGHSLGGAVAALLPALQRVPTHVVTFNAPGIKEVPDVYNAEHSIINIRARYDFISAIDQPIGPVWSIDVPEEEAAAKKAFALSRMRRLTDFEITNFSLDLVGYYFSAFSLDFEGYYFSASVLAQHSMEHLLHAMERLPGANNRSHDSYAMLEKQLLGMPSHQDAFSHVDSL